MTFQTNAQNHALSQAMAHHSKQTYATVIATASAAGHTTKIWTPSKGQRKEESRQGEP